MSITSIEAETQAHLLTIRKALADRNAAVMVGAGFSRNAEGGENLATWRQLSEALASELQPTNSDFTPTVTAQLAEQYARVFSPTHLEQLIKRHIPDDQVSPGPLHTKLLELPWSEVFTTNYDTLLERAAERMFEAPYFTVCAREDIPQSKILGRRRIVKLHGSFPSHRPFILTEEDYRTYPTKFAPFVNLVRQSLLENIFCLIGFSGDDPNFLHWLGWVHDMLDKHALPVYLFLAKEPTLGEQKLYEARGVTPVLLPTPENITPHDYSARYRELFNELSKPLFNSPLDWADHSRPQLPSYDKKDDEAFSAFLNQLPALIAQRNTYPGWIVAPKEVRRKFRQVADWLKGRLQEKWLRDKLARCPHALTLLVIDLYCWAQSVILEPLLDDIAKLGQEALLHETNDSNNPPKKTEKNFDPKLAQDNDTTQKTRIYVALSLLAWARQSHHKKAYLEIRSFLQPIAEEDTTAYDSLVYQEILNCLQQANHSAALKYVTTWHPKSADAYTHVLRGALIAELTDATSAIPVLEHAIRTLRRQQRSRPADPALISREAWACLVARLLQEAMEFSGKINSTSSEEDANPDETSREREDLDSRLDILVSRGYSAREELNTFLAKLDAEALPSDASVQRQTCFNLGTTSAFQRFGPSADFQSKIIASFAWLELVERIGLPPRTKNVSFYTSQNLQAAWWVRFADTIERPIGILLRANQNNALKPRDSSLPMHRTGWLERQEVARLPETAAIEIASEMIEQLEIELGGTQIAPDSSRRGAFLLEVLGRLSIRITNFELLNNLAERLIRLHRASAFQAEYSVWEPASEALKRILEALPQKAQNSLLLEALRLPLVPSLGERAPHRFEFTNWVNFKKISSHYARNSEEQSPAWREIIEDLIHDLKTTNNQEASLQIWIRLDTLRRLNILSEKDKQDIGDFLWDSASTETWPTIPGFYPIGTLFWPAPLKNPASQLLDQFLGKPLRPFSSGNMTVTLRQVDRTYRIGDTYETFGQIQWIISNQGISLLQIRKFINNLNDWLDAQQQHLIEDLHNEEIYTVILDSVTYIDKALETCVKRLLNRKSTKSTSEILHKIIALNDRLECFPFTRIRVLLPLISHGEYNLTAIDDKIDAIVRRLLSDNEQESISAFHVASTLLQADDRRFKPAGHIVFDTIATSIFTRRTPYLSHAIRAIANLPRTAWQRYLTRKTELLLDAALTDLEKVLDYKFKHYGPFPTIQDESIPLLRYYATQLAYTLINTAKASSDAAHRWVKNAEADPLPEIRLGRYKQLLT